MGFHTYDVSRADALDDPGRYERVSREELLGLLDPAPDWRVADVGSGTGFYTDDVAAAVASVCAIDVQPAMHARYRENGVPANVDLVTAVADHLPFRDGAFDGVFSTMTYHEFATEAACAEVRRVLVDGGRLAIADWSAAGPGEAGPPASERFAAAEAVEHLESAGFEVLRATEREETFVLAARA